MRRTMDNVWTYEDVKSILIQLDDKYEAFGIYHLVRKGGDLCLLGRGASSYVFACKRKSGIREYAIKVIGFSGDRADPEGFENACSMQKQLQSTSSIVRIYKSGRIIATVEGEHTVCGCEEYDGKTGLGGDRLLVQFVIMERLTPILKYDRFGKAMLVPEKLRSYNEKEILKLAFDVGVALDDAHKAGMIHRDIKPENVFYDEKTGHYKLGDFGIARQLFMGVASTCAFTKGYGAPEVVGILDEDYDETADIYSFGMMIYVLLNELKFPGSDTYRPNLDQYRSDFKLPNPLHGKKAAVDAVRKMTEFDPLNRQKSMDEVLNDIENAMAGNGIKYKKNHLPASVAVGAALALSGTVAWKLSFGAGVFFASPSWLMIFAAVSALKMGLKLNEKRVDICDLALLVIGVWGIISTGFAWWKLALMIVSVLFDVLPGAVFGVYLLMEGINYTALRLPGTLSVNLDLSWIAVLCLSLSFFLLFRSLILSRHDYDLLKVVGKMKLYRVIVIVFYVAALITRPEVFIHNPGYMVLKFLHLSSGSILNIRNMNFFNLGLFGLVFCIFWMIREKILSRYERKKQAG